MDKVVDVAVAGVDVVVVGPSDAVEVVLVEGRAGIAAKGCSFSAVEQYRSAITMIPAHSHNALRRIKECGEAQACPRLPQHNVLLDPARQFDTQGTGKVARHQPCCTGR